MSERVGIAEYDEQVRRRDAAIRERDLAEQTLTRVETERLAAVQERDEAWAAAREILVTLAEYRDTWWHRYLKKYPRLQEEEASADGVVTGSG